MKMISLWIHILIFIFGTHRVYGASSWVYWVAGKSFYYVSTDARLFSDAQTFCVSEGANLIEVDSIEEHNFIVNHMLQSFQYWVGMAKTGTTEFRWINSGELAPPGIPWYGAVKSTDSYCYYRKDTEFVLDGRAKSTSYNYICEFTVPTLTPTMTLFQTQIEKVTHTVTNTALQTVAGNNIVSTVDKTIIQTVENIACQTVDRTVTHTLTYEQSCSMMKAEFETTLQDDDVQKMVNDLQIVKKETRAYKRSLVCANDPRPSAKLVGWFGLSTLLIITCVLVSFDLTRGIRFLHDCCNQDNTSSD